MTADAFQYLKTQFPEDFKNMEVLIIEISRFDLFRVKKKKKKTNADRYGEKLAEIIQWLDDNCDQPYYSKTNYAETRRSGKVMADVSFYFVEPTDAMAFKLMFK